LPQFKTAANMLFYNLSVDLKPRNITVLVLHPGIVKTNMGRGWKQGDIEDAQGAVEPGSAANALWKVLMGKGLESTGKFFYRNGEELPW
jgi:NAD(P)-dependent dehydrogenase (short-subunit alcohol dehydrogenase family)